MHIRYGVPCLLAVVGAMVLMNQASAQAANKVVVIPLNSGAGGARIPTVTSAGQVWMDRNLGALRVAGSKSDSLAYGWLYQWGRPADGHESRTSPNTPVNSLSAGDVPGHGDFIPVTLSPYDWRAGQNDNLWQGVSGVNNPCPAGFRLPTETEWETERASWSSNEASGAFASPLKLPVAGYRSRSDGSLLNLGFIGWYWSATVTGSYSSRSLYFVSDSASIFSSGRAYGFSVRCIED